MNPRKCAKLGFVNTDVNQLKCVGCKTTITLKSHLNFSNDIIHAKRMMQRLK